MNMHAPCADIHGYEVGIRLYYETTPKNICLTAASALKLIHIGMVLKRLFRITDFLTQPWDFYDRSGNSPNRLKHREKPIMQDIRADDIG